MSGAADTCWAMIEAAARGDAARRETFANRCLPVVRSFLVARWSNRPRLADAVDDATQDVFLECCRSGGALERADRARAGGFRAYFYGIARNVARRVVAGRRGRAGDERAPPASTSDSELDRQPADDDSMSRVFDRAWARTVLRRARAR